MNADLLLRSQAARLIGVSVSTLALWERLGRVRVAARAGNGVRLYTREEVERLATVRRRERLEPDLATATQEPIQGGQDGRR